MYKEFLDIAANIARNAGALLLEYLPLDAKEKHIRYKSEIDIVTEADIRSQEYIADRLQTSLPDHGILAEEDLETQGQREFVWIVDPLDGTTNFAHTYPIFCVSIGLAHHDVLVAGVVYDPNFDELFTAEKDKGAQLNGEAINVSNTSKLSESLLATGFPYWTRERPGRLFDHFRIFTLKAHGVRRAGSAALDMCAVACGRLDGFWEEGLKPWDTAAASVIVNEAGGMISKFDNSPFDLYTPQILATNGHIHKEMIRILTSPAK